MSKVICDICGTQYPESASQCPICGFARTDSSKNAMDESEVEDIPAAERRPSVKGGRFSTNNVRKRNRTAKQTGAQGQSPRNNGKHRGANGSDASSTVNKVLNILLVIVILALLAVSSYIFIAYFMPNFLEPSHGSIQSNLNESQAPIVTTEPTIPCTGLNLRKDYNSTLKKIGDATLLNVEVTPENTTDEVKYSSSDESVLVVSTQGRVTAVGQGEATVTITCGTEKIACKITSEGPDMTTEPATEEPTEGPTQPLLNVDLKIDKSDFTLYFKGDSYTLNLKCELESNQVTWYSDNDKVATIDENGKVIAAGKGTTKVYAKYGDQIVECIVRCK